MKKLFYSVISLVLLFSQCLAPKTKPIRKPDPKQHPLRVISYNVNFGLYADLGLLQNLASHNADVILLQETNESFAVMSEFHLSGIYPHQAFRKAPAAGGLGVLSRYPFEQKYIANPNGWFVAGLVTVDTGVGKVQLLNVHLHPPVSEGGSFVYGYFSTKKVRLQEIQHFYKFLKPNLPTLVLGDFNEDRDGLAVAFLRDKGFQDVVQEYQPKQNTWRWKIYGVTLTDQLDHIFYNQKLSSLSAKVLRIGRSDHFPVLANFHLHGFSHTDDL
ncbi:MAG: endonuclease/exonuclease/phosphatase family protein [Spirochaetota bacterium]